MEKSGTLSLSHDQLLTKAQTEDNFAYIAEVPWLTLVMERDCNIVLVDDRFYKVYFAFPVTKDFPYIREFNQKYVYISSISKILI